MNRTSAMILFGFFLLIIELGCTMKTEDSAVDFLNRGKRLASEGLYEKAVQCYSDAIRLNSQYAEAYFQRAQAYYELRNDGQARQDCEDAMRHDPKYSKKVAGVYAGRGKVAHVSGRYDEAVSEFTDAIRLYPTSESHLERGIAYHQVNKFEEAIKDFTESIEQKPNFDEAYYHRGVAYYRKGEPDRALKDLSKAIQINSQYARCFFLRGVILHDEAKYDDAVKDFDEVIRLNFKRPSSPCILQPGSNPS